MTADAMYEIAALDCRHRSKQRPRQRSCSCPRCIITLGRTLDHFIALSALRMGDKNSSGPRCSATLPMGPGLLDRLLRGETPPILIEQSSQRIWKGLSVDTALAAFISTPCQTRWPHEHPTHATCITIVRIWFVFVLSFGPGELQSLALSSHQFSACKSPQ